MNSKRLMKSVTEIVFFCRKASVFPRSLQQTRGKRLRYSRGMIRETFREKQRDFSVVETL